MNTKTFEALQSAENIAGTLVVRLQEANASADPVESVLILQAIDKAVAAKRDITALIYAISTRELA